MRELELAGIPSLDALQRPAAAGRAPFKLSRTAFWASAAAHAIAAYALSRHVLIDAPPSPSLPPTDFFFERVPPAQPEVSPAAAPEAPADAVEAVPVELMPPAAPEALEGVEPAPRAAESAEPLRAAEAVEPRPERPPTTAPAPIPAPVPAPPSSAELDEARLKAAEEIVAERAAESPYLRFSIDDVAAPRPAAEPEPRRSIFDSGPSLGSRSVGRVGQQRTRIGRKLVELCNALTNGGFGVLGLFSACESPDEGPSGFFPEVRPAYLDMLPECVDTRDTAPALALEAPFSTIKCRMVRKDEPEE